MEGLFGSPFGLRKLTTPGSLTRPLWRVRLRVRGCPRLVDREGACVEEIRARGDQRSRADRRGRDGPRGATCRRADGLPGLAAVRRSAGPARGPSARCRDIGDDRSILKITTGPWVGWRTGLALLLMPGTSAVRPAGNVHTAA